MDFYFKLKGDDKDYPVFNYGAESVLRYSNNLDEKKIEYLEGALGQYVKHIIEKQRGHIRMPGEKGLNFNDIKRSNFYHRIEKRINLLKRVGVDHKVFNSYKDVMNSLEEANKKYIRQEANKIIDLYGCDLSKILIHAEKLKIIDKRILYLEWVKKEFKKIKEGWSENWGIKFLNDIDLEIEFINKIKTIESSKVKQPSKIVSDSQKILWKQDISVLSKLFEKLFKIGFTENVDSKLHLYFRTETELNKKYKNSIKFKPISWKKEIKDLAFLIEKLIEFGFVAKTKDINKLFAQHFSWKGSEIKPSQLADLKSKIKNPNVDLNPSEEIKDIVEKLKNKN